MASWTPTACLTAVAALALLTATLLTPAALAEDPTPGERAVIEGHVLQLGADEAEAREAAQQTLAALGETARPFLEVALDSETQEIRRRASALLETLRLAVVSRTGADLVWAGLRGGPTRSGGVAAILPASRPRKLWSVRVHVNDFMDGAVIPAGDRLYCLEPKGVVRSFSADEGRRLWTQDLERRVTASAVLAAGRLVIPTDRGLVALAAKNGRTLWKVDAPYGTFAAPAIAGGLVYGSFRNVGVKALDLTDGTEVFNHKMSPSGALLVQGSLIVTGTEDGRLVRIDPDTGEETWRVRLGSPPLMGPTLAAPGLVVVFAKDRYLRALEADTGKEIWRRRLRAHSTSESLAASGGRVYVTDSGGALRVFEARTGHMLWWRDTGMTRLGGPCATPRRVVFGAHGQITCRDAKTGDYLWRMNAPEGENATPSAWGDRLFILFDGELRAYR